MITAQQVFSPGEMGRVRHYHVGSRVRSWVCAIGEQDVKI